MEKKRKADEKRARRNERKSAEQSTPDVESADVDSDSDDNDSDSDSDSDDVSRTSAVDGPSGAIG